MKLVLALLLLVPLQAERTVVLARHGRSLRGTIDGRPFLVLRGSAAERGEAQGRLAGKDVLAVLEGVASTVQKRKPGAWDAALTPASRRFAWPARFEEELTSLAAALPGDPVPALGRKATLDDLRVLNVLSDLLGSGCSSFSAWGKLTPDGQVVTGRNLDYGLFPLIEQITLVAVVPSEQGIKPTLELSIFGSIGASTTLNADGAFLALHDEPGLPSAASSGWVPRTLALRQAIETAGTTTAVEDVATILRASPARMGQNVHVSGPGIVPAVLEWDGNAKDGGVTVRRPEGEKLACTNHYVARTARDDAESRRRYDALLAGTAGPIDFEAAKKLLDRVSASGSVVTYASVVVWPASKRYAFAISPKLGTSSTRGRWTTVEWSELFEGR